MVQGEVPSMEGWPAVGRGGFSCFKRYYGQRPPPPFFSMVRMPTRNYGRLLVLMQLGLLAALLLTGPWIARTPALFILELSGAALAAWAVLLMRAALRATPEPAANGALLTRGPYRWIRHPMYTGLLLATLALMLDRPGGVRLAMWVALCAVILVKLLHEERLLAAHFPGYRAYQSSTKRLIPFLF